MKTNTNTRKPRNPWVAAAPQRKAGAHHRSRGGVRHRLRVALQRELQAACKSTTTEIHSAGRSEAPGRTEESIMTATLRSFHPAPTRSAGRLVLAGAIRAMARLLQRVADRVTPREVGPGAALTLPRLEFHADAGAPEGALYVDGVLFGHLPGIHRL